METNFNRGSLKIVYAPLMEYFKNIQENISGNLILVRDEKKVATNYELLELLDKVQSILKMSGLSGVVKVLSLIEEGMQLLKEVKFDTSKSILVWEASSKLFKDIENYLKQLIDGSLDEPTRLFEQYKKLADLMGKQVEVKDLFVPKLELINNTSELSQTLKMGQFINEANKNILVENVKKSHVVVQQSLVTLLTGITTDTDLSTNPEAKANHHGACKKIYEVLNQLQEQKISKSYYILFGIQKLLVCISTPVFNDTFKPLVFSNGKDLKVNLARIEKTLKNLVEELSNLTQGDKTGSLKVDDSTVKETLYFIIQVINNNPSLKSMPVFQELSTYFNYNFYADQLKNTNLNVSVTQANPDALNQVNKLLIDIKEELVILTGKKTSDEHFNQHISRFYVLINKYGDFVNKDEQGLRAFCTAFLKVIDHVKTKKVEFNNVIQKEVAISVVLLEYATNLLVKMHTTGPAKKEFEAQLAIEISRLNAALENKDVSKLPMPSLDNKTKETENRKILVKVFDEVSKEIKKTEEVLDTLLSTEYVDEEELMTVFPSLKTIKGILAMLGNTQLGEIVQKISDVWMVVKENGLEKVDQNLLKSSISWLSGISLFIIASNNNNPTEAKEIENKLIAKFNLDNGRNNESVAEATLIDFDNLGENSTEKNSVELTTDTEYVSENTIEIVEPILEPALEQPIVEQINVEEAKDNLPLENLSIASDELVDEIIVSTDAPIDVSSIHRMEEKVAEPVIEVTQETIDKDTIEPVSNEATEIQVDIPSDPSLLEIFLEEMSEVQNNLHNSFKLLKNELNDQDALLNIRRGFHTLKGSGKMVGLNYLGEFAWTVEQELNSFTNAEKPATQDLLNATEYAAKRFEYWADELKTSEKALINVEFENNQFLSIAHPVLESQIVDVQESHETPENTVVDTTINSEIIEPALELALEPVAEVIVEVVEPVIEPSSESVELSEVVVNEESIIAQPNNSLEEEVVETAIEDNNEELSFEISLEDSETIINNESTLQVENAEEAVEESVELPVSHEEVVEEPSTININGVDVNYSLYDLFKVESAQHIEGMRRFVESTESLDNVTISYDFMRYAHTLASIARAVNLQTFAELANKIEVISYLVLEQNRVLSQQEMTPLVHATHSLEIFNKIQINENELAYHSNLLNNLTKLEEKLLQESSNKESSTVVVDKVEYTVEDAETDIPSTLSENEDSKVDTVSDTLEEVRETLESSVDNSVSTHATDTDINNIKESENEEIHLEISDENINETNGEEKQHLSVPYSTEEFSSLISRQLKEVVEHSMEEVKKSVDLLNEQVEEMKSSPQNVNPEEIVTQVMEKVEVLLDDKYNSLMQKFSEHENIKKQETETLMSRVEELHDVVEQLKASQKEGIDSIRKDLRGLAGMLKKKSSESYQELFGDEITPEIDSTVSAGFDIDSLNLEKLDHELQDEAHGLFHNNPFIQRIFEDKISSVEDEIDLEIYEISKVEVEEMFSKIEELLENVTNNELNLQENEELKRYLHTFKGSVRMAGANKMGAVAHRLESLLEYSEDHSIPLFTIKPLIQKELIKLHFLEENKNVPLTKTKELWLDNVEISSKQVSTEETVSTSLANTVVVNTSSKDEKQYIRIVSNMLDDLINAAGEVRLTRTTLEGVLSNNKKLISDLKLSANKIAKIVKEIEVQAETQIAARRGELFETGKEFDPLEFDRFTRLQELTRFMNEAVLDVRDTVGNMDKLYKTQENAVVQQSIITNYMLDSLMEVRLIPVESISARLYKITRNTSKEMGKHVNLELDGETTQMDRLVLDRIQSPLEHLLRNCIAHGIEMPNIRELNNKPTVGKIKISIGQEGNFIIIKVSDDGAGINLDKVKNIGYQKGLLTEGRDYSRDEIIDLIFKAGFSTADSVSQVAGRGVGMDVVKNEIFSLGGSIKTETEQGKYTRFTIVLPVAVATNQAMLTDVGGRLIAIPAILVDHVVSLKRPQLEMAYEENIVDYKGKQYPLYYLGHLMGVTPPNHKPEIKSYNTLILVSYLDQEIMIHVDKLETTDEILIKQMGPYFGKISGLLGATLLGDGRQGVVVNPVLLKDHFNKNVKDKVVSVTHTTENKRKGALTVMVVDDSITIRRATFKILEKYGYNIVLAKDGEDGLEQLQTVVPDIILSDIEMPVMDGFEFVKNIKNLDRFKNIPIIMITSRTADKHRNLAYSLGVNGYLGKPYQEEELIKHITELTKHH